MREHDVTDERTGWLDVGGRRTHLFADASARAACGAVFRVTGFDRAPLLRCQRCHRASATKERAATSSGRDQEP